MPGETVQPMILTNDQSLNLVQSLDLGPGPQDQRKSPSSRVLEAATMNLHQQLNQLLLIRPKMPATSSTQQVIAGAPGDGAHPPVTLVPRLIPPRALLLAPRHVHAGTEGTGDETDAAPAHTLAQDGVPDPIHAAGAQDPGGDATGRDLDPTTETGDDTRHIDVQDHVLALDMAAAHDAGVAAAEGTVHRSLPVAPPTAPLLLTEGHSTPPQRFLTS